jgi:hypothetical protein
VVLALSVVGFALPAVYALVGAPNVALVTAAGAGGADGDGQDVAAADQHDQAFGQGDGGVEQVAPQQGVCAHGRWAWIPAIPGHLD